MSKFVLGAIATCLFLASPPVAADPIDGTWKGDPASIRVESSPSVYLLRDGIYSCLTCRPQQRVPADGEFHAIKGHARYDELSVSIEDSRSIRLIRRKTGRVVGKEKSSVSSDGARLDFVYESWKNPDAPPDTESGSKRRVRSAPDGAHSISGSWVTDHISDVSAEQLTTHFQLEGDVLRMVSAAGESYVAKLNGTDTPMHGDPGQSVVSVRRIDPVTIEETLKRAGIVLGVTRMTISPDGQSMTVVWENKVQAGKTVYVAHKQ